MRSNEQTAEVEEAVNETEKYVSDLRMPIWSVISFDRPLKMNLTYSEASELMRDESKRGVSGLCIVTDEAAERFAINPEGTQSL